MDFKERIMRMYPDEFNGMEVTKFPVPFYMAYPGYAYNDETSAIKDLEYLQQTYPSEVRKYMAKITQILDKLDYNGSFMYDEYPDRSSLWRLSDSVVRILKDEEEKEEAKMSPEEWKKVESIVQILLCNEIYKRRHGRKRMGFIKF